MNSYIWVRTSVGQVLDFVINLWFQFLKTNYMQRTSSSGVLRVFAINVPYVLVYLEKFQRSGGCHERTGKESVVFKMVI